jgi:hypothetical protein
MKEFGRFLRRRSFDDAILAFGRKITQDLGTIARGQDAKQLVAVADIKIFDQFGRSARVLALNEVAKGGKFSTLDQLAEVGHKKRISHKPASISLTPWEERTIGPLSLYVEHRRSRGSGIGRFLLAKTSVSEISDHVFAKIRPQNLGNIDPTIGTLIILENHDHGPGKSDGRTVERVDKSRSLLTGWPVPNIQTTRLVIGAVGGTRHLTVFA